MSGRSDEWTVRTRLLSFRLRKRTVFVAAALLGSACACSVVALMFGPLRLPITAVVSALSGNADSLTAMAVFEWRMPVVIAALMFGGLLGLGGAIFQSLTRNPLGSPDVIGFDAGSYTAVVVAVLVIGRGGTWELSAAAIVGGLATAALVTLFAWRRGLNGTRLILVGIACSAMLGSTNAYLVSRADLADAMTVGFWSAGSLSRVTWESLIPAVVLAVAVAVSAAILAPGLRRLALGDDVATTIGTRVHRVRLALMLCGVSAIAVVTAAAGPIGFVALAAPQVAQRLCRSKVTDLAASAGTGAALLAAANLASLWMGQVFRPVPVGVVTVCLGGMYLMWLLLRQSTQKRRSNGCSK